MKLRVLFLPMLMGGLLWSCNPKKVDDEGAEGAAPPAASSGEVLAELKSQAIGGKLVGNTVMLAGGEFVAADLAKAPEYYLVYYSASW